MTLQTFGGEAQRCGGRVWSSEGTGVRKGGEEEYDSHHQSCGEQVKV